MLFSIIVPIYKVEEYLAQCVDSILEQSYTDFEVILVDDGSPDNCPKMCDDYAKKDKRVKVVHKENGGLISARKAGLEIAQGDYIVNIDGDDFVKKDFLSTIASAIEKYSVDMVCFGYEETDGINSRKKDIYKCELGFYDREKIEKDIFPILFESESGESFPAGIVLKVTKKEVIKPILSGIDSRIVIGEDAVCSKICLFFANSIYVEDKSIYCYRTNLQSLSKVKKPQDVMVPLLRAKEIQSRVDLSVRDLREQLYRSTLHALFNAVTTQFYSTEKYGAVKKKLKQVLKEPFYDQVIRNCKTKSKKLKFAKFALKHRCFWLIKLYSKIK